MNRFLSTSHKIHNHEQNTKSGTESSSSKHDFHAYLCRYDTCFFSFYKFMLNFKLNF